MLHNIFDVLLAVFVFIIDLAHLIGLETTSSHFFATFQITHSMEVGTLPSICSSHLFSSIASITNLAICHSLYRSTQVISFILVSISLVLAELLPNILRIIVDHLSQLLPYTLSISSNVLVMFLYSTISGLYSLGNRSSIILLVAHLISANIALNWFDHLSILFMFAFRNEFKSTRSCVVGVSLIAFSWVR